MIDGSEKHNHWLNHDFELQSPPVFERHSEINSFFQGGHSVYRRFSIAQCK